MSLKLGMDGKLYRTTLGGAIPDPEAWTLMGNVRDVTLNMDTGEADVTTRSNNGWKAKVGTYVFFVKTSTASVEVYMFKGYVSHAAGPYIVKNTSGRLRFQFADADTNLTWDSAAGVLPDNTEAVIVVRYRRGADGVSARVNGTEVVLSPLDTSGHQEIIGGPTATTFAHRDDTNGNILASWSLSPHEQDETLVYDTWLTDAECALIENGGAFRDLSPVPVLDSVDVSAASTLDDAFVQVVTGEEFDLEPPAFRYPGLGLTPVSVTINGPTQATLVWNLNGQTPGLYDLEASNSNGDATPLVGALDLFTGYRLRAPSRMDSGLEAMTLTSPSRLDAILGFRALIPARLDAHLEGMTATRASRMDALNTLAARVLSRLTSRIELTVLTPSRLDALLAAMAARQGVRLDSLTLKGWDIWATDTATEEAVLLGFIAGDADPKELADIALADGVYEIEARPSEWFWPGARSARVATLITDPDGGGGPITGLPVIQNLRRELVAFKSRIRWDVVNEQSSEAFKFGLWFGPTSPVDTSGSPDAFVSYRAGKGAYEVTRTQVATEYVAVAAFTPDQLGEVAELLMPWDLVAPDSPVAQHGDPAGP